MNELYVPLCTHQDYIGQRDLDDEIHEGFTIGKRGKIMFWYMIWHSSGHCTVFEADTMRRRWVNGDTMITIHFK